MEKMMTFEEWDKLASDLAEKNGAFWEPLFHAARLGTIPAENAVVIPPVGEWPEGAEAIYVGFYDKTVLVKKIAHIPRPKPVWVPKVGEAVFVNWGSSTVVCRYLGLDDGQEMVIAPNGDTTMIYPKERKPFHESHIGKPWDAIPGGVV